MLAASPIEPFADEHPAAAGEVAVGDDNVAPTAFNDAFEMGERSTLAVSAASGVLSNDVDADHDPLQVVSVSPADLIEMNADGSFVFHATEPGTFRFTYTVADPAGLTDQGQLAIHVVSRDTALPVHLVDFAKALSASGARLYGWAASPFVTEQVALFEDGAAHLPYVEAANPDGSANAQGDAEKITAFPTWIMPDGNRLEGLQTLEDLASASGISLDSVRSSQPFLAPIETQTVLSGSPLHLPIDAYDPDGEPIVFEFRVDNPNIVAAQPIVGNRSLLVDVERYGEMLIHLYEQRAQRGTDRIIELADAGFYDGIEVHRIIEDFVFQFGDPTASGTGGSQLPDFDDHYHPDLQYNRSGVFGFAKSVDDSNNSQVFIADQEFRHLDFNHTVIGQLIEGERTRANIDQAPTAGPDRGVPPVVISSVDVVTDSENGLLMLKAPEGTTGTTNIEVIAIDQQGNRTSRHFVVNVEPDTINNAAFLGDLGSEYVVPSTGLDLKLTAVDIEGDPVTFSYFEGQGLNVALDSATGDLSITPEEGFVGTTTVVFQASSDNRNTDRQHVSFIVEDPTNLPTDPSGDGFHDIDDIDLICNAVRAGSNDSRFDTNQDGQVELADLQLYLESVLNAGLGDTNLDGVFNSADLVSAVNAGHFEDDIEGNSRWSEGDWNCDGEFTTRDLVDALKSNTYSAAALPHQTATGAALESLHKRSDEASETDDDVKRKSLHESSAPFWL